MALAKTRLSAAVSTRKVEILSMSDLHLGHAHTRAPFMINNLNQVIKDGPEFAKLDLLIIAGDIFDRMLNLPEDDVAPIKQWVKGVLYLCDKHNVVLRIIEGTPRHDRRQSQIFQQILDFCGYKVDFRYVDVLEIERHEGLGLDILYIPDEWRHDCKDSEQEFKDLLKKMGLEKVDIAIMHGMFEYQLPEIARKRNEGSFFNSENFLKLVRHYIFIGHNHHFSQLDRIVAHGSFDRTGHGYESPKGCVRATLIGDDERYLKFVENKGAKIYKSIEVSGMEEDEVNTLVKQLAHYPEGSHFKFLGDPKDFALRMLRSIRKDLRTMHLDSDVSKKNAVVDQGLPKSGGYIPMQFSRSNITGLILKRMAMKEVPPNVIANSEKVIDVYVAKST